MLPPATIETLVRDHQRHLLDEGHRHRLQRTVSRPVRARLGGLLIRTGLWLSGSRRATLDAPALSVARLR